MTNLEYYLSIVVIVLLAALCAAIREIKNLQKEIKSDGKANADFNNLYHKYLKLDRDRHELILMNHNLLDQIKRNKPFYALKANDQIIAYYCKN